MFNLEVRKIFRLYSVQRRTDTQASEVENLCFIRDDIVEHLLRRKEKKKRS